ncbi:MAG: hypothetical protein L0241_22460 [Planctomycetia bacterium]|nr:hypothetical protein [Planctomycetia bacterium]
MVRAGFLALFAAMLMLSGGLVGQDKKEEPKKDDPPMKLKGRLPPNWTKLGLTDKQVQDIYKIQNKYDAEIDKLEAKIKELKSAKTKESVEVLTPNQKKRLEEILLGKDK